MLDFFLDQLMLLGGPWHVNDTEAVKEQQYGNMGQVGKEKNAGSLHTATQRRSGGLYDMSSTRQSLNQGTTVPIFES